MLRTINDNVQFPQSIRLLGDILVRIGIIDKYDLKWAVDVAVKKDRPLGEVLQELELVTPEQIQLALDHQNRSQR